jgi:hypothetical protein
MNRTKVCDACSGIMRLLVHKTAYVILHGGGEEVNDLLLCPQTAFRIGDLDAQHLCP